jgi:hypothetical protein
MMKMKMAMTTMILRIELVVVKGEGRDSIEMLPNSHSEDEGEEGEVVENQANTVCISENLMH